jgi:hypothetical protein
MAQLLTLDLSMSELEFVLLTGVLIQHQHSNTMELEKNSWKKSKNLHSNYSGCIKDDVTWNHGQNRKNEKKVKNPRFYGQNKLLFGILSFSPWAVLAE